MTSAELIGVTGWHINGRHGTPADVISFELSTGETMSLKVDRREGSLLLRAIHPSTRWRVLDWEPHWSPNTRVEIRPSVDDRATARVVDPGSEVTAIYRVSPVVALAVARQGGLPIGIHRSFVGRCAEVERDDRTAAEIEEFGVFLAGTPGPLQNEEQVLAEL